MISVRTANSGKEISAISPLSLVQRVAQPESALSVKDLDHALSAGIRNYERRDTISLALAHMYFSIVVKNADKDSGHFRQANQYLNEMPAQLSQYGPSNN